MLCANWKKKKKEEEGKKDARGREGKEFTAERGDLETQTTFHPADFGVKDCCIFGESLNVDLKFCFLESKRRHFQKSKLIIFFLKTIPNKRLSN